jgi:hypothetical protein
MRDNVFFQIYGIAAGIAVPILIYIIISMWWWWNRTAPKVARTLNWAAKRVAKFRWYVHMVRVDKGDGVLVELASDTVPREQLYVYFRYSHPDCDRAAQLTRMQIVEFTAQQEAIETELPFEIAAHLRLKDRRM